MAPLGGHDDDPAWADVNTALFLKPGQSANRVQAAVAAAFRLPAVQALALGTGDPAHLTELANAARLDVDLHTIEQYRTLIRARANVTTASEEEQ